MSQASARFGPYIVYEQLGQGGMAEVHRAEQTGIEGFRKMVALKRMLPHVAANSEMVKSFVREARLASFLRHQNVAQTYELGKVDDTYFIAMELIEGRNLREVLRRLAKNGSRMPVPIALDLISQICDALDYAHNLCDHDGQPLGIIHRDVSPSNIIVADDGLVKLIDFGIAKASARGMQTMSGTIKGKFGYMAPEYINGTIDARADLFAIGVIAHELFTNRPLFTTNDDIETLQRVRSMEISPPSRTNPGVPREIDDIIMTALARDPNRRWQHATALRTAITTVVKRLGLGITSDQVVHFLEAFDFDKTTAPVDRRRSPAYVDEGESMILTIEPAPTSAGKLSGANDHKATLMIRGPSGQQPLVPLVDTPVGTPRALDAQKSLPPGGAPLSPTGEYQEAVRQYNRHEALVPSGSFLADEIMPTQVRPSEPKMQAQAASPAQKTMIGVEVRPSQPRISVPRMSAQVTIPDPEKAKAPERAAMLSLAEAASKMPKAPPGGRGLVVLLVLLAAAVAATAVYFLLPLFIQ